MLYVSSGVGHNNNYTHNMINILKIWISEKYKIYVCIVWVMYPKKIMYKMKFASALFLWLLLLVGDTEGCATNKIKDPGGWHLCEARIVIIEYWKRPNWGQPRLQQGKLFVKKEKITGQKLWRLLTKIMMAKFLWENIRSCQQEEKEALLNCQIWIICVNTLWISNIVKVDIYSWVYIFR